MLVCLPAIATWRCRIRRFAAAADAAFKQVEESLALADADWASFDAIFLPGAPAGLLPFSLFLHHTIATYCGSIDTSPARILQARLEELQIAWQRLASSAAHPHHATSRLQHR